MRVSFPFSAIVAQDEMKLALLLAAVDARIGGVMVFGDRGTGKSTAARALAERVQELLRAINAAFADELAEVPVVEHVHPSGADFLLVKLGVDGPTAAGLAERLLLRDNIYVKNISGKFTDGGTYWRLAVRSRSDNSAFCAALARAGR